MKTLNLVYPELSDIKYKITRFPDGQQDITIEPNSVLRTIDSEPIQGLFWSVQIKSRSTSFKDLELIICATKALQGLGVKQIHLYTPYMEKKYKQI